eukprot:TRINITY_DN6641_c0_g1_i1.p2 TRINITY_DN6641_c0_g1~~TRINITY_DN6641_c0_g1_i1.p2  ORF type:complete len:264 (+),score=73.30 TRINITY_DN6641_c0_g1_i1:72-863(+)
MPRLKDGQAKALNEWVDAKRMREFDKADKLREQLRREGIRPEALHPAPPRLDKVNQVYESDANLGLAEDWRCDECQFINFGHRLECKCCEAKHERGKGHSIDYERRMLESELRGREGFGEQLWNLPSLRSGKRRRGSSDSDREEAARAEETVDIGSMYDESGRLLSEREIRRKRIRAEKERQARRVDKSVRGWDLPQRSRSRSDSRERRGNRKRSRSEDRMPPPKPPLSQQQAPRFIKIPLPPGLHEYKGIPRDPFANPFGPR